MRYVAFLRGINVGGNKAVKMDDLKKAFESQGFRNVKTLLASGNVIFESGRSAPAEKIAAALEARFGFPIPVLVRSFEHLEKIAKSEPFKGVKITPDVRLFVTFLSEKPKKLQAPWILRLTDSEIFAALDLSERTVDYMSFLDKNFGMNTTRNWNTIEKILKS